MSLAVFQKEVDDWAQTLKEPYWPPLSQLARLTEEVGEVARLLNHLHGSKPKKSSEENQELGEELADAIFAIICIANRHKIDLDKAFSNVLEKPHIRDKERFAKK